MDLQQQQLVLEEPEKEVTLICQFYIKRKSRPCKFQAVKGSKYCAAHCSDMQGKVECPYEKGFFISAKKLQKHLKICPMILNKKKQETSQWFSKDINKGQQNQKDNEMKHDGYIAPLIHIDNQVMDKIVKKIIDLYQVYFKQGHRLSFIESSEKQALQTITNDHLQAKMITDKAFESKLIAPDFIYVQFGAGKGILSYAIAMKIQEQFKQHSHNILLQRQSRRNKFDRYFRQNPFFQRFKGDVSNFDFKLLPKTMTDTAIQKCGIKEDPQQIQKGIFQKQLIGICKHMCGEALDISMRGLLQGNAKGCILASCCHHLCKYSTYLNPNFFEKEGLNPQQIQILFKISSWGTMAYQFQPLQDSLFDHLRSKDYLLLLPQQKILIGRMCKRLIDQGRAQFLSGKVYRYCSDQLTPQNYVIISHF